MHFNMFLNSLKLTHIFAFVNNYLYCLNEQASLILLRQVNTFILHISIASLKAIFKLILYNFNSKNRKLSFLLAVAVFARGEMRRVLLIHERVQKLTLAGQISPPTILVYLNFALK